MNQSIVFGIPMTKNVKGKNIWTNGNTAKSYSVRKLSSSWQYRIRDVDEDGKVKEISKSGFKSEDEARKAAEDIMNELYGGSATVLRSVK